MEYKQTLNMNKSGFPMRGGLPMREPDMLKHWQELDLYNELLKKNEGKPRFALHDGPPFSNGALHMGHALNKCIKDFMIRSAAMRGYYTPYIPGWDNHGMPIESAIIKKNKLNHKAMPIPEFRSACHDFAQHYIDVQMEGFKRLGVVADWEHPYKTMAPSFEAEEVKVFGAMYKKGYIYKGLKPVYWCYHDETALAEAEIEYQDDPCTTVYVKFPLHDDQGKLTDEEKKNLSFVIWTTTIWTLPGNLAIALNPVESYVIVRNHQNGEQYLVAEALMEKVMKVGGVEDYTVVSRHEGAFFENMLADHPFLPKTSRLVLADYVTMDSGTGCVHTAPGFGADDYQTCRRYGMDMVVPVNDQGRHTDYAGKYAGMLVEESNPVILKDMQESGALFASEQIVHSYPHCWRCKKPIIFRATPQWFCSVDSFKDEAIAACDDVRWVPAWGKDRMRSMILERTDWCISRQRRWGLPIPVFYCRDCGKPVCTDETIAHLSELFDEYGIEVDPKESVKNLITAQFKLTNKLLGLVPFYVAWVIPFSTFMIKNYIESIPRDFDEAVYVDGGSIFTVFFRIVMPLASPAIASVSIFNFLTAWDEYQWALTVINDNAKRTLPIAISGFFGQHQFTQWGYVFAMSMASLLPVLIIFICCQKYFVSGLQTGGIKG